MINIVGAGLSGLSASVFLARKGIASNLISNFPSERAQSVMAEGGINGALNTMGEDDNVENHFMDTMKAGGNIEPEDMVRGITENAPKVIRYLQSIGVPFNLKNDEIQLRNFGGQKKKRTAYARSSTGKVIMSAFIDEARKFEVKGLIKRYSRHEFLSLILSDDKNVCKGLSVRNRYTGEILNFEGEVILANGGFAGVFPELTTGTTANTGDIICKLFSQGVRLSNLEMIQYHPTTIKISDKCCLVSEAARGEGGRLFINRGNEKWYFMEEKYPELKNLMPRDVVAREIYFAKQDNDNGEVYLDLTGLSREIWKNRLPDLRDEIIHYLKIDPKKVPVPINPAIHYFMGGIDVDINHRTNLSGLYAVGECAAAYHGANRLGGNSLLGAIYSGMKVTENFEKSEDLSGKNPSECAVNPNFINEDNPSKYEDAHPLFIKKIRDILFSSMGIVRNEEMLEDAVKKLNNLQSDNLNEREKNRLTFAKAIVLSAIYRKESRGANYRSDYPERNDDKYRGKTLAILESGEICIDFKKVQVS